MTRALRARRALARWYEGRRLRYPWRERRDPYRVLVSEVMLQQTQAGRVAPAFVAFIGRFPTVEALAAASRADVLRAWGTLGYNRRAVALHEAARVIVRDHDGQVPPGPDALVGLPGVGPYTAAAVVSLAYGVAVPALDTNVRRVIGRAALGRDDAPGAALREAAAGWLDPDDPAGWNQAVMDVGRELCRPRPRCEACPLASVCRYRARPAVPPIRGRRQSAFEGSSRQLRGRVIAELRILPARTIESLSRSAGVSPERIAQVVRALAVRALSRPARRPSRVDPAAASGSRAEPSPPVAERVHLAEASKRGRPQGGRHETQSTPRDPCLRLRPVGGVFHRWGC